MGKNPAVSVLTAVYNGERYIKEAIDSVLAETYEDFEYIIVDNHSTDGTSGILEDYARKDGRIRVVKELGPGPAKARNAGLQIAKGDWVAIMDADDIALPDRFAMQLNYVKENQDISLLGSDCLVIDENGSLIKKCHFSKEHKSLIDDLENMRSLFGHSSWFLKRKAVIDLDGYRERFPTSEDTDLCLRLSSYGRIACIGRPLVKIRKHRGCVSDPKQGNGLPLLTVAALVCHLRRKTGLSDPSIMEEKTWRDFLDWLEERLENMGVFQKIEDMSQLREIWYSKSDSFLYRLSMVFHRALSKRSASEALLKGIYPRNLTRRLTEESISIFAGS